MKYLVAAVVTAAVCLFIVTAPPTIYLGDSGEIAAAAVTLGIGHPPGYPLYTLCGKIFSLLPLGDEAFRINLLAAVFGSLTLLMLFQVITYTAGKIVTGISAVSVRLIALAFSVVFIFSGVFWFQATHAKGGIYAMECLMVLAAFYSALKYSYEKKIRYYYLAAWVAGFLPAIHFTAWLVVIFIFIRFFLARTGGKKSIPAAGAVFFLAALLTSNLYIFIRAPEASMRWSDLGTTDEIIRHITRAVYFLGDSPPLSFQAVFFKLKTYMLELALVYNAVLVFAGAGIYLLYHRAKNVLFLLGVFFLLNLAGVIMFTNNNLTELYVYTNAGFYLVNDMVIILFAAFGVIFCITYFRHAAVTVVVLASLMLYSCLVPAVKFAANNRSRVYLAYDLAENIFKSILPGDTVFARSDLTVFGMHYVRYIKKKYKDIKAYDEMGNMLDVSYLKNIRENNGFAKSSQDKIILEMYKKAPGTLHFVEITAYPDDGLVPLPLGILYKLSETGSRIKNAGNIMKLYSLRDCFNNRRPDYINRNIIARYYVKLAEFAAIEKNPARFNFYREAAERTGFDIPNVLRGIAYVFFTYLNDVKSAMLYLEKSMENDPMDFPTLNLIIEIYTKLEMWDKVLKWYDFYYKKEWDYARKSRLAGEMKFIREKYGVK